MADDRAPHPLRVLIVDDEQPAREHLRGLLRASQNVTVAGTCGGGQEALDCLEDAHRAERPVDLLFLDVQMPEVGGFDVVEALQGSDPPAPLPVVVFVTAYDRYALQAFDAHAVDYLLKPYSDERFEVALERARHFIQGAASGRSDADDLVARMQALLSDVAPSPPRASRDATGSAPASAPTIKLRYLDRIALKERGRVRLLPTDDIRWIGAADVYVEIHTVDGRTHLHRALLGDLEERLDPRRFVRIHRSHLVRVDLIDELLRDSHGTFTVVLDDGTMLKLSRTYRKRVQERLGQSL
jgi:two-component system LytT family response regulator